MFMAEKSFVFNIGYEWIEEQNKPSENQVAFAISYR